jgi:hypothetical protein
MPVRGEILSPQHAHLPRRKMHIEIVLSNNGAMSKLAVYRFALWDKHTGENVESLRFATLKAINLHAGRNIEHSRRIVDESDIDTKGILRITNFIGAAPPRRS